MDNGQFKEMYKNRRIKLMNQFQDGIAMINFASGAPDPLLYDKNLPYSDTSDNEPTYLILRAFEELECLL